MVEVLVEYGLFVGVFIINGVSYDGWYVWVVIGEVLVVFDFDIGVVVW